MLNEEDPDLPSSCNTLATLSGPCHKKLHKVLQPPQDEVYLGTRGPLSPTAAFGVEPGIFLLTSIEHGLC